MSYSMGLLYIIYCWHLARNAKMKCFRIKRTVVLLFLHLQTFHNEYVLKV